MEATGTVVQWVRTSWTKRSRGGPAATLRNRAPTAFPLPPRTPPLVHRVLMHEADGFRPRSETHEGPPPDVLLQEHDGLLRVLPTVTPFGMPRRWRRPPAVRLAPGEWVRWQINHRFANPCDGDWAYRLDTLNIAHGPAPSNLFLGPPPHYVDERAPLR
ncbi:hypothetical protein [Streptomyces sp. C]|uniref:hypothetical protein n=1 Tax=Streptomyces sp. C TaxID=253839 RepID=UPI0001B4B84C|nr:hypothetical protein [Streptomyces sp. C]EFL19591.1 predicted protein [Streptomyces sp. C]